MELGAKALIAVPDPQACGSRGGGVSQRQNGRGIGPAEVSQSRSAWVFAPIECSVDHRGHWG